MAEPTFPASTIQHQIECLFKIEYFHTNAETVASFQRSNNNWNSNKHKIRESNEILQKSDGSSPSFLSVLTWRISLTNLNSQFLCINEATFATEWVRIIVI